jgi:hypothetical protein
MPSQTAGLFRRAFREFLAKERDNILNDVNERNLCQRLSIYLQRESDNAGLAGYYANTEYNRNQGRVKTILDDAMKEVTIICDLVLHSIGTKAARENIIAIEMKKSNRPLKTREKIGKG